MSGFTRTKRVTDPLDDRAKARIFGQDRFEPGYISSGSEHSAHHVDDDDDVVSSSLSDLFYGFVLDNDTVGDVQLKEKDMEMEIDSDVEREYSSHDSAEAIRELKYVLNENAADSYRNVMKANVCKAIEMFSCRGVNKSIFMRNVMSFLINLGYNAAVCKTKWESSGGLTAGNYEFIDVVRSDSSSSRYFIGLDFAGEFEIARPTSSYERLLQSLPRVFIGKAEELKKILRIMSDAARRSLKSRDLHLPPWRKHRFMQNKWLGPYKRTANIFPASFSTVHTPVKEKFAVKCRSVGFDANAGHGRLLLPAATRTR